MEVNFLPIAQMEIDAAFDWYEKQAIGLGYDLLDALNDTLRLVVSYPELHPLAGDNIRRCLFNRFPYALYYGTTEGQILVVAVAHLRRKPGYWHGRLKV